MTIFIRRRDLTELLVCHLFTATHPVQHWITTRHLVVNELQKCSPRPLESPQVSVYDNTVPHGVLHTLPPVGRSTAALLWFMYHLAFPSLSTHLSSGILVRTWANALGKQRLLARKCIFSTRSWCCPPVTQTTFSSLFHVIGPWNHLMFGMVGGYVGYNYKSWEASLLASVNEKRALRGMPEIERRSMA